jgi:hypothetical protein
MERPTGCRRPAASEPPTANREGSLDDLDVNLDLLPQLGSRQKLPNPSCR